MKQQYKLNTTYDPCSYPGIQCKFYYDKLIKDDIDGIDNQSGQQPNHKNFDEISFMIFRTGSVLIVGKCDDDELCEIYEFLKELLHTEYSYVHEITSEPVFKKIDRAKKLRRKIITIS